MMNPLIEKIFGIRPRDAARLVCRLAPREIEALELIVVGADRGTIAQCMGIAINTVGVYRNLLKKKLNCPRSDGLGRIYYAARCAEFFP